MNVMGRVARLALMSAASLLAVSAEAIELELVKDTDTSLSAKSSLPRDFRRVGSEVYFTATRADVGMELFATSSAPGSVRLVADLAPGGASSYARVLGALPGGLLVAAAIGNTDGDWYAHSTQILRLSTDGSERLVLTALAPWYGGSWYLQRFEPLQSSATRAWFRDAADGSLWASDGSAGATGRVFDTAPSGVRSHCAVNDRLLFVDYTTGGRQLYLSDGTAGGTVVVVNFASGSAPSSFVTHAGYCYFLQSPTLPSATTTLWRSDGTVAGTIPVTSMPSTGRIRMVGSALVAIGGIDTAVELRRVGETEPFWQDAGLTLSDFEMATDSHLVLGVYDTVSSTSRLLVTDATAAGTRLVQSSGSPLVVSHDTRATAAGSFALLRTTTASFRVDVAAATAQSVALPDDLFYAGAADLDGVLVGNASSAEIGEEIWRSDGTVVGTQPLADIANATADGLHYLRSADVGRDNTLFYAARSESGSSMKLWRSNGSAPGTQALPLRDYDGADVVTVRAIGNGVVFGTGTLPGTLASRFYFSRSDFSETWPIWQQGGEQELLASDHAVFFSCRNAGQWNACGVPAGATQALPLLPDASRPVRLVGSLGAAAVLWQDGTLWRSDGTPAGTVLIASNLYAPSGISSGDSVRLGDRLYFEACTTPSQNSCGLHVSDGTPAGTRQIVPIYWPILQIAALDGIVYFMVDDPPKHLWRSDGTLGGTQQVTPLNSRLFSMIALGHRLHLLRNDTFGTPSYLVSDGTAVGTVVVAQPTGMILRQNPLVAFSDNDVLLSCSLPSTGYELCRAGADGSGFALVGDFFPGPQSSEATWLGGGNGVGYMALIDGQHGAELWRAIGDRIFSDRFQ